MPKKSKKRSKRGTQSRDFTPRPKWGLAEGTLNGRGQVVQRRVTWASASVAAAGYLALDTSLWSTSNEYSGLSGLYQRYRMLALKAHFFAGAAGGTQYYLVCTYRGTVTASAVNNLWQAERPRLFEPESTTKMPPSYEVRPTAAGEDLWLPIGTNPASSQISFWGMKIYNGSSQGMTVFYEAVVQLSSDS